MLSPIRPPPPFPNLSPYGGEGEARERKRKGFFEMVIALTRYFLLSMSTPFNGCDVSTDSFEEICVHGQGS